MKFLFVEPSPLPIRISLGPKYSPQVPLQCILSHSPCILFFIQLLPLPSSIFSPLVVFILYFFFHLFTSFSVCVETFFFHYPLITFVDVPTLVILLFSSFSFLHTYFSLLSYCSLFSFYTHLCSTVSIIFLLTYPFLLARYQFLNLPFHVSKQIFLCAFIDVTPSIVIDSCVAFLLVSSYVFSLVVCLPYYFQMLKFNFTFFLHF